MLDRVGSALLELHRGGRDQRAETLEPWAMNIVKQVIPHDGWFWGSGCVVDGEIVAHTALFGNVPPESMGEWERHKHLDVFAARSMMEPNEVHNVTHEMFRAQEIYRLHYRRLDIEQMLGAYTYNPATSLHDAISLYRFDPHAPFAEAERTALACMIPHLIEIRRTNYLERMTHGKPAPMSRHALAAVDAKGIIHVAGPDLIDLVRAEWPEWTGPRLPVPLGAGRAAKEQCWIGKKITVLSQLVTDMWLLRLRPRNPVDELSKREREVACHFANGLTNKEIARAIGLSPATVRNHVRSVYAKLAVGNKAEMARALAAGMAV